MNDTEKLLITNVPTKLLLGGEWRAAEGDARFDVLDPSTGEVLCSVADASPADGMRALDLAVAAQAAWARTSPRTRSDILQRAYQLVHEHEDRLALIMTLEMGKPLAESHAEIGYGAEFLRWFAEEAVRVNGRYTPVPEGTGTMVVTHRPVGPCLLITPWNFPLAMATRKIAPALAAGCTVIIKPAALTPLTTLYVARLFEEAGVPAGVINVVTTSRSGAVCAPIIADPRLRKLSFTGSTDVGRALLRQAADSVLRTSMELGGNAPFIVFDDADLDDAVQGALAAKFRNTGQACTAANRFLVHESVADRFAATLADRVRAMRVGRGTEPGVTIGPLIDDAAVTKADSLVHDAVSRGARLLAGGSPIDGAGSFYEPSVLTDVDAGSRIFAEEIFGPVVSIVRFGSEDEAVALANASEYGLAAYVYTRDLQRARRMIELIDSGMMGVNAGVISNAAAPFGGVKQSGLGREGGAEGIYEYLETKYSLIPSAL
ncbi:NAD-dependent succinate-semialdehyde dehydrogenase [Subtercola lobariae]|uniref:NAD-dependent succinate-semialdehyde dehydrogenase n=1 Tax=Subtercola lobariae TaxID=1588641 RepID=A0A917EZU4_9MICO|nr:NAD-dependent succinate-semialdehyde dehydrogenase [Subtercola lobariae]GGF36209.1 NAD-dependent succinate-semialdehyde dehydrogenase [Subtercola lobariae]